MSGKNNVNPDRYKVAGRDRPGEDVVHERQKQALARERAELRRAIEKEGSAAAAPPESGGSRKK